MMANCLLLERLTVVECEYQGVRRSCGPNCLLGFITSLDLFDIDFHHMGSEAVYSVDAYHA
jgi:hypothetical protein